MKKLIKIIYNLIFILIVLIKKSFNIIENIIFLLRLKFQDINFNRSKNNLNLQQKNKFKKINDRHTRIHLKELADMLESELEKYESHMERNKIQKLKRIININLNKENLKNLTILYTILFETPKNRIIEELNKFLSNH